MYWAGGSGSCICRASSHQWGAPCVVGIVVEGGFPNFRRFLSPPHTPAGFGIERSLMLMIKWDLGFSSWPFFVQLVIYLLKICECGSIKF